MRTAYFDCFAGAAGDMITGALIDAGANFEHIQTELAKLTMNREFTVSLSTVTKSGISASKFDVEVAPGEKPHRHLKDIVEIIDSAGLDAEPTKLAKAIFKRLARAEAQAHNCTIEKVHFHEVGAVDSIVDIVAASIAFCQLGIERVVCSSISLGNGTVKCDHGIMPVPAPATARLVAGALTKSGPATGELTTPTGAAILTELASEFGPMPEMRIDHIGMGAGTRDIDNVPNVTRIFVGVDSEDSTADCVYQLTANLDDTTGELIGSTIEKLLTEGALDAWARPIVTKKNRPAWELSALCAGANLIAVEEAFFRETTTFGVRRQVQTRSKLSRSFTTVETELGPVRVKLGKREGKIITASPEFADCKAVATSHNVSVREVMNLANQAVWKEIR